MLNKETPFLAKATILEHYAHVEKPSTDPVAVEVVTKVLESKPELRAHFFRSGPSAAWAPILWEKGFFSSPPLPQESAQGTVLPQWDVQYYLESVASQVPEIVIKHVLSISGHWWHLSHGVRMLLAVPVNDLGQVVPRITEWLSDPETAQGIAEEVANLIERFAREDDPGQALVLLRALTKPELVPEQLRNQRTWQTNAERADEHALGTKREPSVGFEILKRTHTLAVLEILEQHLLRSFQIEAERAGKPDLDNLYWWRNAIEDSDQDIINTYNDRIIAALRDTLEVGAESDPEAISPTLSRFLKAPQSILRRLGLHTLHRFPENYPDLVSKQLLDKENLDEISIRHEYFLLLEKGFPQLSFSDQQTVIGAILEGPDSEKTEEQAKWAHEERGADLEEYVERRKKHWIRDRLWMIRSQLEGTTEDLLDRLVLELGAPEHPESVMWSSGTFWVKDISPFDDQELSTMSPDSVARLVRDWQQGPTLSIGPERVTLEGLANAVAKLALEDLDRFEPYLPEMACAGPEYAYRIFARWGNPEEVPNVPWHTVIGLSETVLETVDSNLDQGGQANDIDWREVRLAIARLLKTGLSSPDRELPTELLTKAREILIRLVDDADPDLQADRPGPSYFGHNDPISVALNHVRPVALSALVHYALRQSSVVGDVVSETSPQSDQRRLEPEVKQVLSRKLDKQVDPSRAVHSILGQYLPLLYYLDGEWVRENLGRIFPPMTDEESAWYYVAAWDAYIFNRHRSDLMELLRPQYTHAIENIGRGYFIKSHLNSAQQLATHVAFEYLLSSYELASDEGKRSLIAEFFAKTPPEIREKAAWAVWRICDANPTERGRFWPRALDVWKWRAQESSKANHSPDFDSEMDHFAHLLLLAPEAEDISTLRPLLEGILPHLRRSEWRDHGWDAVEKYLATQVNRDPVRVIQFYSLMYDSLSIQARRIHHSDEARIIIQAAVRNVRSREETLALIDFFARRGDYTFRGIYEEFSH